MAGLSCAATATTPRSPRTIGDDTTGVTATRSTTWRSITRGERRPVTRDDPRGQHGAGQARHQRDRPGDLPRAGGRQRHGGGAGPCWPSSEGWRQRRSSGGSGGPNPTASSSASSSMGIGTTVVAPPARITAGRVQLPDGPRPDRCAPCGRCVGRPLARVASRWPRRRAGHTLPSCGAIVTFTGTARDHAARPPGVHRLEYEAYEEHAVARLEAVAAEVRARWPEVGRVALLHRTGVVDLARRPSWWPCRRRTGPRPSRRPGSPSTSSSAPCRSGSARAWDGGESWGLEAQHLSDAGADRGASTR